MNTKTKKTIESVAASAIEKPRLWNVEVLLGKNIVGNVLVKAIDKEKAKEKAFVSLDFKVKKAY